MIEIGGVSRAAGDLLDAVDQRNAAAAEAALPDRLSRSWRRFRCRLDRFDDFHIAGAAAEIAGQCSAYFARRLALDFGAAAPRPP